MTSSSICLEYDMNKMNVIKNLSIEMKNKNETEEMLAQRIVRVCIRWDCTANDGLELVLNVMSVQEKLSFDIKSVKKQVNNIIKKLKECQKNNNSLSINNITEPCEKKRRKSDYNLEEYYTHDACSCF